MREELDEGLGEDEYFLGSDEFDKVTVCSRLDITNYSRALSRCALPQPLDVPFGFAPNLECDISPIKRSNESVRGRDYDRKNISQHLNGSRQIASRLPLSYPQKNTNLNNRLAAEVQRYEKMVEKLADKSHNTQHIEESNFIMNETTFSGSSSSSVVEVSRHKFSSPISHRDVEKRISEQMLDLTLSALDDSNRSVLCIDEAIQTEPVRKNKGTNAFGSTSNTVSCQPRYSEPSIPTCSVAPFRLTEEFKKQFRGPLIDIDSIEHKGGVARAYENNLRGKGVASLLSQPRCRSASRPRRTFSSTTFTARKHNEKPPFCSASTKSSTGLTHAVHANEQLVVALVNSRFPHWRLLLQNILNDNKTGDNIAVRFLEELELRQRIRDTLQADEQHTYDLQKDDEKVIRLLRNNLSKSSTSRIQQLRILHSVLQRSS